MERRNSITELIKDLNAENILDVGCKFGVNPSNLSKDELSTEIANKILNNLIDCFIYYSIEEREFISKLINEPEHKVEADIDMNAFVCDGILGTINENGKEMFYATDDLIAAFKNVSFDNNEAINKYDNLSSLIIGMVKTYGIISFDELYDIYTKVALDKVDYDTFEHFIFYRSELFNVLNLYEHDEQEFLHVDEVDEPHEIMHMIMHNHVEYRIYSEKEYIDNSKEKYVCDNSKLKNIEDFIRTFVKENDKVEDLIDTIVYDTKIENSEDLILDMTTYITIATNEEHEKVKSLLEEFYNTTVKWTKKGNV